RYTGHQLKLWPSDARPRVTPVSLRTGSPGVAADYRVWGSLAHVCAIGANKLSPRTHACVFLGFPLDTSGWQFYDPVTCQFFSSQDVTFDDSLLVRLRSRSLRSLGVFLRTVRFLTRVQHLDRLEREEREQFERACEQHQQQQSQSEHQERVEESLPHKEREEESRQQQPQQQHHHHHQLESQSEREDRVEQESQLQQQVQLRPQQERVEEESRLPQQVLLQPQRERAQEEPQEQQRGQVTQQLSPEEVEQQRLRDLPDSAPARFVHEPRRSRYRADGPFHLVLRSHVPPPPVLPQPPKSSLSMFHDPLSDYLRASRPVVSRVLSVLVTHPTAPPLSVSALVTTVSAFSSSHRLDYAAHLVSGTARSPSSGGAPVFPLEVLEDRQFELGFLAAAVPHLCAMLLAPEGDPDALDILIPRSHTEAVSGP
ncbi:unnamed protein product, partial [Closterium sp. NIES-54]